MDVFSPVAPAAIRVLVLPIQVERSRFTRLLKRLQDEASVVRLTDIDQNSEPCLLSPQAFPQGRLLFRYTSAVPPPQTLNLSPFELYREPLLVLGIIDDDFHESGKKKIEEATQFLREKHPRVVHRQLISLSDRNEVQPKGPGGVLTISHGERENDRSVWTTMRAVSAQFLIELSTFAKAMQASPSIQTPGQTSRSLQRSANMPLPDDRPGSSHGTPPPIGRMPRHSGESSPRHSTGSHGPPATSFDQMPSVNGINRSDSNASNQGSKNKARARASSNTLQGFGSGTSQEKIRARGKARVGIVLGSIYMMAGQWSEALRILVDHTSKARSFSDSLWQAKGMELLLICQMLHAWVGVDFQIPSICLTSPERSGPGHVSRLSATLSLEDKPSEDPQERRRFQVSRFSKAIPDLTRSIIDLYRTSEGALDLPSVVVADATVRFARLLAVILGADGLLNADNLRYFVTPHVGQSPLRLPKIPITSKSKHLSRTAISELLAQALPPDEESISTIDHIALLAGIASTYSILGLDRKKGITIKEMIGRLTAAMMQARKLGAAEMGIHPAASLSIDTGADSMLSSAADDRGLHELIVEITRIYGILLVPESVKEFPTLLPQDDFGNPNMKQRLLRELAGFCETSPDPYGLLRLSSSLLQIGGPNSALDRGPEYVANKFSKEEQMALHSLINRTVAVSRHFGLADAQAVYWDPFLVRDIEFATPNAETAVIDRSKLKTMENTRDSRTPGNPLLYDPNASRPGTAVQQKFVLVDYETSNCVITLQNPFDFPVELESLGLITEGVALKCHFEPTSLRGLHFQRVSLPVTPTAVGETKIVGVRIKIHGCYEQSFPIIASAWRADIPLTVKALGLGAQPPTANDDIVAALKKFGIESKKISTTTIEALPKLELKSFPRQETGLMMLEGETESISLALRNTSQTPATIFKIKDTNDVLKDPNQFTTKDDADEGDNASIAIKPGQTHTFDFKVLGKAGVSGTRIAFYYCTDKSDPVKFARMITVALNMTVNAALHIQNFTLVPATGKDFAAIPVTFDLANAWPRYMHYSFDGALAPSQTGHEGQLVPGEVQRIFLRLERPDVEPEASAEQFWVALSEQLQIKWKTDQRSGTIGLKGMPLPVNSRELLHGSLVDISVSIQDDQSNIFGTTDNDSKDVRVGSFTNIRVQLHSRSKRSLPLHVQLVCRNPDFARNERRLAVAGTLQRILPPLAAGAQASVDFVVCPLLLGILDFDVVVRQARLSKTTDDSVDERTSQKSFSLTAKGP